MAQQHDGHVETQKLETVSGNPVKYDFGFTYQSAAAGTESLVRYLDLQTNSGQIVLNFVEGQQYLVVAARSGYHEFNIPLERLQDALYILKNHNQSCYLSVSYNLNTKEVTQMTFHTVNK